MIKMTMGSSTQRISTAIGSALAALTLSACATSGMSEPVEPLQGPAEVVLETQYTEALQCLADHARMQAFPPPRIAVGHITDFTGANDYFSGRRLTQGAALMAMTALADAGMRVVERFDMGVIQAELGYTQSGLVRDSDTQLREVQLGQMQGADLYIVGGLTEFNPNIRSRGANVFVGSDSATGGAGALGVNNFVIDVGIDLRLIDVRSSDVLSVRAFRKQIVGREVESGVFQFLTGGVIDINAGGRSLEPVQTAVRSMIDRAVFEFVAALYNLDPVDCLGEEVARAIAASGTFERRGADAQAMTAQAAPPVSAPPAQTPAEAQPTAAVNAQTPAPAAPATHLYSVHLESYRRREQMGAGWAALMQAYGPLLAGLSPGVDEVELRGASSQGQFFRLIAGPLPDEHAARELCEQLSARDQYCRPYRVAVSR
jgi:holdfast attachment protein HfaB